MHTSKESIPVKFAVPGATARQLVDFGDATGFGDHLGLRRELVSALHQGQPVRERRVQRERTLRGHALRDR